MVVLNVPPVHLYVEIGKQVIGVGDEASLPGFVQQGFHLVFHQAGG